MKGRVFLLAILLLIGAPLAAEPKEETPLWNVLMKLGAEQDASKQIISDYIRFWKSSLYTLKIEPKTKEFWESFRDGLNNFDIENIHEMVKDRLPENPWHGLSFGGKRIPGSYQITLFDPHLKGWVEKGTLQWDPLKNMGDFAVKIFTRPQGEEGETYKMKMYGQLCFGDLKYSNLMKAVDKYLHYLHGQPFSDRPILPKVEEDFSNLESQDKILLSDLARDLPRTYKLVQEYLDISSIVEKKTHQGRSYTKLKFDMRYRISQLRDSFPKLYRYLKKIAGLIKIRARVYNNQGHLLGIIIFDSKDYSLQVESLLRKGLFIPCAVPWEPSSDQGHSPFLKKEEKLTVRMDIKVNLKGIQVVVRNLQLGIHYKPGDKGATTEIILDKMPVVQKVSGSFYGIIPIWLINIVIPSNVLDLIKDFFKALTRSDKGKGSVTRWTYTTRGGRNYLDMESQTEVLNNGLIKLGLRIFNEVFMPDEETQDDMLKLNKKVWHAFVSDYFKFSFK